MDIRVMEHPALSTEDALRRSLPLFREGTSGTGRRALCWPSSGRGIWIVETPGLNEPLCGEVVHPPESYTLDYHYAESFGPDDVPADRDFRPVPRRWLDD